LLFEARGSHDELAETAGNSRRDAVVHEDGIASGGGHAATFGRACVSIFKKLGDPATIDRASPNASLSPPGRGAAELPRAA
jgi:hypothetical protein